MATTALNPVQFFNDRPGLSLQETATTVTPHVAAVANGVGAAVHAPTATAAATPAPAPAPAPAPQPPVSTSQSTSLRLLADLAGKWVGTGFSVLTLPFVDPAADPTVEPKGPTSRVKLNATMETIEFTPLGGTIPNRGKVFQTIPGVNAQEDIFITGLSYLQQVSDQVTNSALHVEPGMWLNIPSTINPPQPSWTVARLGTIPHGDSILARGIAFQSPTGLPAFDLTAASNTTPSNGVALPVPVAANLPPGFLPAYVTTPNQALQDEITNMKALNQVAVATTVIIISTTNGVPTINNPVPPVAAGIPPKDDPNPPNFPLSITAPGGHVSNIPFVTHNANATKLDATFWIETIQQTDPVTKNKTVFLQLQYTQRVILHFNGVDFPHVAVATLVKQ